MRAVAAPGNDTDPFADAGAHYDSTLTKSGDTDGCPHPYQAGDLRPLFVNDSSAFMIVADKSVHREGNFRAGSDRPCTSR